MNSIAGVFRIIGSAIFMIAGLVYCGSNVMVYSYADGMMRQQREWANPKDPLKNRKLSISEHRTEDGKRFKTGYLELAKFSDIDGGRDVSFSAYARIKDLLQPGESAPTKDLRNVFVESRAILYAKKECEILMQAVARECAVNHANGRSEGDVVHISGSLRFVQRDDLGDFDTSDTWVFSNVSDRLVGDYNDTSLTGGAADRAVVYRKSAQKCAEIKRREGNCAITSINAKMMKGSKGGYKMDASAEYAFLIRQRD